jgi:hypothetical protein
MIGLDHQHPPHRAGLVPATGNLADEAQQDAPQHACH